MSSQGPPQSVVMSTDLPFFHQRLSLTRRRAHDRVEGRLKRTAYTLLGAADQATVLAAIYAKLRARVATIMPTRLARTVFPYDTVVEAVIAEVFYDNLALFRIDGEDDSTVEELLNWEG
ncbi:hypothetical protein PG996_002582 [Apiospora saccharicola]|uniref:Uncharacterized protein n=1 Tax=Apiospora saccharicola TaxID=335842 RepID=A0ABR1WJV3_9PEZI